MKLKLFATTSFFLISSFTITYAQSQKSNKKELGLSISRFSFESIPFNMIYKWGKDQDYWRIEAGRINAQYGPLGQVSVNSNAERNVNLGLSFLLAKENRKQVSTKFSFYHGVLFGVNLQYRDYEYTFTQNSLGDVVRDRNATHGFSPILGYSIGGIFSVRENLYLSAQLMPSIQYNLQRKIDQRENVTNNQELHNEDYLTHSVGFNATQGAVQLGLFYRFNP